MFYANYCCFLFQVIMVNRRRRQASNTSRKRGKRKVKRGRRKTRKYRKSVFSSRFPHRSIFKSKHLR